MKTTEFLKENDFIGQDAQAMHQDHQHQMLREECYHLAVNAVALHKMLGELPDAQPLEAWAAEKISLANDYLHTVKDWLEGEMGAAEGSEFPGFDSGEANAMFENVLGEGAMSNLDADRKERQYAGTQAYHAKKKAEKEKSAQDSKKSFDNMMGGPNPTGALKIREQGVAEGIDPFVAGKLNKLKDLNPVDRASAYGGIRSWLKDNPELAGQASKLASAYSMADVARQQYKTAQAKQMLADLEPQHQAFIKQALGQEQGVAEGAGKQLSVQQLATISDAALDSAYGYGRSQPGNTFGWQANLKSAAFAKQMIDKGITDVESISDAIHKGWNVTAQAFVKNPMMFDDSKTMAPEKLQAKVAQRQKLMTQQYAQLPEDEKEKDRVVARAMLQAITGGQQGVAQASDQLAEDATGGSSMSSSVAATVETLGEKGAFSRQAMVKKLGSYGSKPQGAGPVKLGKK